MTQNTGVSKGANGNPMFLPAWFDFAKVLGPVSAKTTSTIFH